MDMQRWMASGGPLALAALVAIGACDAGGGESALAVGPVVRDSAGVRIVEIPEGPVDTAQVGGPVLTIGEEGDPRYEFDGVRLVAGLQDGGVAVVDYGHHAVRYYDASGRHVADVGREGEGPGEFGFISTAQLLPGDTIVVNDSRARRVSYLSPAMTVVRSVSYLSEMGEPDREADGCVFPGWQGALGSPSPHQVLRSWACIYATGTEGSNWYHHSVYLWDPETEHTSQLLSTPYIEAWERPEAEARERYTMRQFPSTRFPTVWHGGIVVPYADRHGLSVYGPDGDHRLEIRDAEPRRPTDPIHREEWAAHAEEFRLEATEGVPFPDSLPAFLRSVVDDDGRFWALHFDVPGMTGQHWRVYDTDGTRLRVVAFPGGFELQSVANGRAFGFHEDQLGIQRPQVYEVPR